MECHQHSVVVAVHLGIELIETHERFLAQQMDDPMPILREQVFQTVGLFTKVAIDRQNCFCGTGLLQRGKEIALQGAVV